MFRKFGVASWVRQRNLFICLILLACGTNSLSQPGPQRPAAPEAKIHDTKHPFKLASDADFLAAMIALSEESRKMSLDATKRVSSRKVKSYAINTEKKYRSEIKTLKKMLAKYGNDVTPDFHFTPRTLDFQDKTGAAAEKYYLESTSQLLAQKIELTEFGSGIAQSSAVKKLIRAIIATKSTEWSEIDRLLKNYPSR